AADRFGDPHYFLKRQLFWALLGLGGLWAALAVDYRVLERVALPLLGVAALLLVLVLVPAFGQAINGTRRWLRVGGVSFQPVELAKLALEIYLTRLLSRMREEVQGLCVWSTPLTTLTVVKSAYTSTYPLVTTT